MERFEFSSLRLTETHPLINRIWSFSVVILIFLIGMLFLPWRQTVQGEGELIAYHPSERVHPISATIDGFINAFHVSEDEHVLKGTKLFTMTDLDKDYAKRVYSMKESLEQQYKNIQQEVSVLRENKASTIEQKKIRTELYDKQYIQAKEQLKSLQLKRKAQLNSYEIEFINFKRLKELYKENIESKRNYDRAENSYINAKAQLDKIDIGIEVQKRNLTMLRQEKQQFVKEIENSIRTIDNSILAAQNRLSTLKREQERQLTDIARYETSEVVAEKDGVAMRILKNDKNTYIRKGEPVIQFSPDVSTRSVLLKVSDFNMPLIKEGLSVRIRFYGWPVLHIPGWPMIRFGTFGGIIKKVDPVLHEKGYYYAYIVEDPKEPWPSQTELRVGTSSTVWVALSNVPIWYQLWRLMNAFPPNMVTPGKQP
jgi:multidrug efflux pump subunit AcrA (membrane-fusion protein)